MLFPDDIAHFLTLLRDSVASLHVVSSRLNLTVNALFVLLILKKQQIVLVFEHRIVWRDYKLMERLLNLRHKISRVPFRIAVQVVMLLFHYLLILLLLVFFRILPHR